MAVSFCHCSSSLFSNSTRQSPKTTSFRMDLHHNSDEGRRRFIDFPYVSAPHKSLMVDLVSTVEDRLGPQLLPCTLPHDVQSYQNQSGTAHASLHIRSGHSSSPIDFILGSWIHFTPPGSAAALDITSLSAYLDATTDAPNFLLEIIRSAPTSIVVILDLPPRKDLALCPQYINTFYEATALDRHRQLLSELPEAKPYVSPSLYVRTVVSPTAIMARVEAADVARAEEILESHVGLVAREVLRVWLESCACVAREVGEAEREWLRRRDRVVKRKTIEVDLGSNLPRIFGEETSQRVIAAVGEYFSA